MHTGTQVKFVSRSWRVPGGRAGEEESSLLDWCGAGGTAKRQNPLSYRKDYDRRDSSGIGTGGQNEQRVGKDLRPGRDRRQIVRKVDEEQILSCGGGS